MKKYSSSFLAEVERFDRCNRQVGSPERTDLGLEQFFEYESRGVKPLLPDRYFTHLLDGKKWWEWTLNEYAKSYATGTDWFGWVTYANDFLSDPAGFRQLRQRCDLTPMDPAEFLENVS